MKNTLLFIQFILLAAFTSCTNGQSKGVKTILTPTEFSKKLSETPDAQLIDVRTPEEVTG